MSQSEVARLLDDIEQTFRAAQNGLTGLAAGNAKHIFITKKMEDMNEIRASLSQIVGTDQAMQLISERLDSV